MLELGEERKFAGFDERVDGVPANSVESEDDDLGAAAPFRRAGERGHHRRRHHDGHLQVTHAGSLALSREAEAMRACMQMDAGVVRVSC